MSSVEQILRSMVQEEIERLMSPVMDALQHQGAVLSKFAVAFGAQPVKRGPGRPARAGGIIAGAKRGPGRPPRNASGKADRCAVIGCKNDARAKGYCPAHYQKYRNLSKTGRLPADWTEHAKPQSVKNIVLPRGRAAHKKK